MSEDSLPSTHRALVQHVYAGPLSVETIPTPQPVSGSAILRVEAAAIVSYQKDIYNGTRQYPYVTPRVPGSFAVGRVAAAGPDATVLRQGMLVYFDLFIRARDDPSTAFLSGISDIGQPAARKLMSEQWRDSTFSQFVRVPLENCFILDEARLCGAPATGGLGYIIEQLAWMGHAAVGYGGLRNIGLRAGETLIIAPATGGFGGAASIVALAMGARVVAMGRNTQALQRLKELSPRVTTVSMSGDVEEEVKALTRLGPADAFLDLSPATATDSTHITSAIRSLRKGGRVSLSGGRMDNVSFPYQEVMAKEIMIKGQMMYESPIVRDLIKLVESGTLDLGQIKLVGRFALEQWEKALDTAAAMMFDQVTVLSGWT